MYRELPSELVTQIEKMPPVAAKVEMEEKRYETLENDKLFLKLDRG